MLSLTSSQKISSYKSRQTSPAPFFQPKLTINQPNDVYEQEADAMADKVMRMPDVTVNDNLFFKPAITSIQRKCVHCEEEEKEMQRKESDNASITAGASIENYTESLNGQGGSLTKEERNFFEPRFGYDFSNVKIHNDAVAAKSAQSINALAYTTGNNIVFNEGQYNSNTDSGKKLLGHELTHVVQQGNGVATKKIQMEWDWGRAGTGALIGAAGGGLMGGIIGAGIGALAGGIIGGVTGNGAATPVGACSNTKTISVDFVRLHGATISPATELAAANRIFSSCCINFVVGTMPPQESLATTKSWLGGDTDVNASGITCAATTPEEKNMYDQANAAHALSGRMRVFLVNTFSGYGAAGFSRPPYCAGGGYPNYVILANVASGATNPLAHEFGHILQNNGVHSTAPNLMAPSGGTVLDSTQCATCYANA